MHRPLEGLNILAGFQDAEASNLIALASKLGAAFVSAVLDAHVFISGSTGSAEYLEAVSAKPAVVCVQPSWLHQCDSDNQQVPFDAHLLAPFTGLNICLTGFTVQLRESAAAMIKENGGTFMPDLIKTCSHLVAAKPTGDKYRYARIWGDIHTVPLAWLEASVKAGRRLDESGFTFDDKKEAAPPAAARRVSAPARMLPAQPAPRPMRIPEHPPDECFFLHTVRLFVAFCSPAEMRDVRVGVRESGATREAKLIPEVTHVLVGTQTVEGEVQRSLREHLQEWQHQVCLVRMSWLVACINERRYVEPDSSMLLPLSILQPNKAAAATSYDANLPHATSSSAAEPCSSHAEGSLLHAATYPTAGAALPIAGGAATASTTSSARQHQQLQGSSGSGGVFGGMWFTLVALEGAALAEADKLIMQGGGYTFCSTTLKLVKDMSTAYAVCPHGLPEARYTALSRAHPDFKAVPVAQRVTPHWLQVSMQEGQPTELSRRTPLCCPLPHALPLTTFAGVRVHCTAYNTTFKGDIILLLKLLGATYEESLSRRVTHLLCPALDSASKRKYDMALRIGSAIVTTDWLRESAYSGRPLDPLREAFMPAGSDPQKLAAAVALGARCAAAAGSGCSQVATLAPTQAAVELGRRPLGDTQLPPTQAFARPTLQHNYGPSRPVASHTNHLAAPTTAQPHMSMAPPTLTHSRPHHQPSAQQHTSHAPTQQGAAALQGQAHSTQTPRQAEHAQHSHPKAHTAPPPPLSDATIIITAPQHHHQQHLQPHSRPPEDDGNAGEERGGNAPLRLPGFGPSGAPSFINRKPALASVAATAEHASSAAASTAAVVTPAGLDKAYLPAAQAAGAASSAAADSANAMAVAVTAGAHQQPAPARTSQQEADLEPSGDASGDDQADCDQGEAHHMHALRGLEGSAGEQDGLLSVDIMAFLSKHKAQGANEALLGSQAEFAMAAAARASNGEGGILAGVGSGRLSGRELAEVSRLSSGLGAREVDLDATATTRGGRRGAKRPAAAQAGMEGRDGANSARRSGRLRGSGRQADDDHMGGYNHMEMSQQVGYDLGSKPADRLLGRGRAHSNGRGGVGGGSSTDEHKRKLIQRVTGAGVEGRGSSLQDRLDKLGVK